MDEEKRDVKKGGYIGDGSYKEKTCEIWWIGCKGKIIVTSPEEFPLIKKLENWLKYFKWKLELFVGLWMYWTYPPPCRGVRHLPKKDILDTTLNHIWWWGSSSGECLVWFYGISTIVGYLMLNPIYICISNIYDL